MDKIYRGILNKGKIRIFLADTSFSCEQICSLHNLNFPCSDLLSRVLSIGSIMGAMQKMGDLTIKITGNGPAKQVIVCADEFGNIRGLVANPDVDNSLTCDQAIGEVGLLSVCKDFGMKHNFESQIDLWNGKIGDDFSYYFRESEQVPSLVNVGTYINDKEFKSGALIIQLMPGYKEEDIKYVEDFSKSCPDLKDILVKDDKKKELEKLIPGVEILEESEVRFKCTCSKERFLNSLACLEEKELEDIINEGKEIETHCNFCNQQYNFTIEEVKKALEIRRSKKEIQ